MKKEGPAWPTNVGAASGSSCFLFVCKLLSTFSCNYLCIYYIDFLLKNWSKVLVIDIYDWYKGVNECGIDLSRSIYKEIIQINNGL